MVEKISILIQLKDSASSGIKDLDGAFKGLKTKIADFLNPFNLAIAGFALLSTVVVATIVKLADLETKMVNVGNLTSASRDEVNKMTDDLMKLSQVIPQSVGDLADSLFEVTSAGVPAAESLAFLESAAKLATAGVTDTKGAVSGMVNVMGAYSMTAQDATRISDVLFATQLRGITTVEELASTIGQVAPVAAAMGVKFEDLSAAMATATLSGIKTSEAATGIKATLSNLLKPTEQAKDMSKLLGVEFDAQAVKSKGLGRVLKDVIEKTGGNKEAMGQLFGSMEAVNTVLAISKDNFKTLDSVLKDVENSAGATEKAYRENLNTLNSVWTLTKNNAFALGKSLLDWLVPVVTITLKAFNFLTEAIRLGFDNLIKPIKSVFTAAGNAASWLTGLLKGESEKQTKTVETEESKQLKAKQDAETKKTNAAIESKNKQVQAKLDQLAKEKEAEASGVLSHKEAVDKKAADAKLAADKKSNDVISAYTTEVAKIKSVRDIDELEEIAMLERLKKSGKLTAESKNKIQLDIYKLKADLRSEDEEKQKEANEKAVKDAKEKEDELYKIILDRLDKENKALQDDYENRKKILNDIGNDFKNTIVQQFKDGEIGAINLNTALENMFDDLKARLLDEVIKGGIDSLINIILPKDSAKSDRKTGWGGEVGSVVGDVIASGVEQIPVVGGLLTGAGKAIGDFFGFARGGIVGGSAPVGDTHIIRANTGEVVLNQSQQARLMTMANGGGLSGGGGSGSNSDVLRQLQRIEQALLTDKEIRLNGDSFSKAVYTTQKKMIRNGQLSEKG